MVTLEALQTIQLVEKAGLTSPLPNSAWSIPPGLYRSWYPKAENSICKCHSVVVLVLYTCCIQGSQNSPEQIIVFLFYIWRDWCSETINKTLKVASKRMGKWTRAKQISNAPKPKLLTTILFYYLSLLLPALGLVIHIIILATLVVSDIHSSVNIALGVRSRDVHILGKQSTIGLQPQP